MRVKRIQLSNFRNHVDSSLEFSPGVNFITGANAQGKTSILEALSYVCLTKSFLHQADAAIVKIGSDSFAVDAILENEKGFVNNARVVYSIDAGKRIFIDGNEIKKSADVIGMFPIVVLSPGDFALTTGAPSERRMFMDMVLSQISRSYLEELIEYRRALKQRNKILLDGKSTGSLDTEVMMAWTDALVSHGSKVMMKRTEFVGEFQATFSSAYSTLVEYGEAPALRYTPSFGLNERGTNVSESFYASLSHLAKMERIRGATLSGPHRDDIAFVLNNMPIREFASQGQHKTFLVALKIAEFHYIKTKLAETPVMLLDDVMTELDYSRATKTIQAVSTLGQAFITATDMMSFDENLIDMRETKFHFVREGNMAYDNVRL
ncbi:MAG TPA: DNA replication/repair protein RecF [Candidatus Acidoferrales bacterium]|nr:DNA replication/repair protein RecF [Candidatus Acidoferrales bacterium]